jgi:hypothetical protein
MHQSILVSTELHAEWITLGDAIAVGLPILSLRIALIERDLLCLLTFKAIESASGSVMIISGLGDTRVLAH